MSQNAVSIVVAAGFVLLATVLLGLAVQAVGSGVQGLLAILVPGAILLLVLAVVGWVAASTVEKAATQLSAHPYEAALPVLGILGTFTVAVATSAAHIEGISGAVFAALAGALFLIGGIFIRRGDGLSRAVGILILVVGPLIAIGFSLASQSGEIPPTTWLAVAILGVVLPFLALVADAATKDARRPLTAEDHRSV